MIKKAEFIRTGILIPFGCVMFLLFFGATFSIYWLQGRQVDVDTRLKIDAVRRTFEHEAADEADLLNSLIEFVKEKKTLQKDWLAKDHEALLKDAAPIFEKIRARHPVTHFYFISPDRRCFLRLHNPGRFGDYIGRDTMNAAATTQKPSQGIELGPYGTLTLRVVQPWWVNGRLAGYLEMGEEVDQFAQHVSSFLGVDVLLAVDKRYLVREKWEEGLWMTGCWGNWDRFRNVVVHNGKAGRLSMLLDGDLKFSGSGTRDNLFTVSGYGRDYRCGLAPLKDVSGRDVGGFVVLSDITAAKAALHTLMVKLTIFCLTVAGLLFLFFYFYVGLLQKRLT